MDVAVLFVVGAVTFAFTFWFSVKILDAGNTTNKLGTAFLISPVFGAAAVFETGLGYIGLVGLLYLLVRYYDVSLIRSFLVVLLMGLLQSYLEFATTPILAAFQ